MASSENWKCPFCGHVTVIREGDSSTSEHRFRPNAKHGTLNACTHAVFCRNDDCHGYTLRAELWTSKRNGGGYWENNELLQIWDLIPESFAKVLPDYVPAPIIEDYKEACRIKELSPKASATLARRCLQGMIRDFWTIRKARLIDEIKELEDKVDPEAWAAIDGVRSVGNIGAHMEADINLIVDVDPDEAGLMLELIETLVEEWYVARRNKQERFKAVSELAAKKKAARQNGSSQIPEPKPQ